MQIQYIHIITYNNIYRVNDDDDDDECDENNNLLYEYGANSVTTTINH